MLGRDKGYYRLLEKLDIQTRVLLEIHPRSQYIQCSELCDVTSRLRSLFKSKVLGFCKKPELRLSNLWRLES